MRKGKVYVLCGILLLLCNSCSVFMNSNDPLDSHGTDTNSDAVFNAITPAGGPPWAQTTQSSEHSYAGLNLDGNGDGDDTAVVSIYRWGENVMTDQSSIIVLRVRLGTGETLAYVIPCAGDFSFQTGNLFSTKKDAIIVEVETPKSNYGAANVFAFDIYGAGEADPFPSIVERLNTTTQQIELAGGNKITTENLTSGTKISHNLEDGREGLILYSTGPNDEYQELEIPVYWNGQMWSMSGK